MSEVKNEPIVRTLVIDTTDRLYPMCVDAVCAKLGISHPSDVEFGKGWSAIRSEWERVFQKLNLMGYAIVMLAHEDKRKEKIGKIEHTSLYPDLPKSGLDIITDLADIIMHYGFMEDGKTRALFARTEEGKYVKWRGPKKAIPPEYIKIPDNSSGFEEFDRVFKEINNKSFADSKPNIVIYGPTGIGKSTLASEFPNAKFADLENGLKWLGVKDSTLINNWSEFLTFCKNLAEKKEVK